MGPLSDGAQWVEVFLKMRHPYIFTPMFPQNIIHIFGLNYEIIFMQ